MVDDFDYQDKNGFSYLHIAVQSRLLRVVETLLQKGAEVNITDKYGRTPLLLSVSGYNGDRTFIDILLSYGADLDLAVPSGMTARRLAKMKGIAL